MRSDMHKVIVERPRLNRSWAMPNKTGARVSAAKAAESGEDFDSGPKRLPSSRTDKMLNEHLNPLERYLYKQVGRPWSKVHSEICKGIDRRSTIGQHVMQHVPDFVAHPVILAGGKPYQNDRWGLHPVRRGLWVHPVTGLLLRAKPGRVAPKRPAPADEGWIRVSDSEWFEKIGEFWWRLRVRSTDLGELAWKHGAGFYAHYSDLLDRKQCDRKTIRRIEAGDFGKPSLRVKLDAVKRLTAMLA